jgi:3-oxoacyl-[acyl-carrier-protein] synthase II
MQEGNLIMRRVVVTGLGLVSPLGCGSELAWSRLLAARSGLAALPEWAATLPARVAGIVPAKADDPDGGFDPDLVVPPKDQRRMDRFILFALVATAEAIAQAAWTPSDAHSLERTATIIASGIGGFPAIVEAVRTTDQRGIRRLSPFTVPSFLANLAAGHISTASRVPSVRPLPLAPRACRRSAMPHASFEPAKQMLRFAVARKPASTL